MGLGDTLRKGIQDATGMSKITDAISAPAPAKDQGDFPKRSALPSMAEHADTLHPVAPRRRAVATGADWDK